MTKNCPPVATIYFDEKNRDKVVQSYHPLNTEEAQKIWKILQNFSLSCRIANCACKLDSKAVELFCREASHYYITSFEEAYNTGVLHCGWAHLGNNSFSSVKDLNKKIKGNICFSGFLSGILSMISKPQYRILDCCFEIILRIPLKTPLKQIFPLISLLRFFT